MVYINDYDTDKQLYIKNLYMCYWMTLFLQKLFLISISVQMCSLWIEICIEKKYPRFTESKWLEIYDSYNNN